MTKEEITDIIFDGFGACGCGDPVSTIQLLINILKVLDLSNWNNVKSLTMRGQRKLNEQQNEQFTNIVGGDRYSTIGQIVLYTLDRAKLIEHGGTICLSWLTPLGKEFLSYFETNTIESIFKND